MKKNIFLIGFMGCGKSTVANQLHKEYQMQILEMDEMIVEREGMNIPQIFSEKGEVYFRDSESKLLLEIQEGSNQVVSCGGGVVLREQNVITMKKNGKIVLLTAKPETILKRVANDDNRPLLKGRKTVEGISELMDQRRGRYEAAADIIVETDDKEIREICKEVIRKTKEIGE